MNVSRTVRLGIAACVLVAASSSMASAEIVYMVSGRTLSVKGHTKAGESVVLTLRGGGDVTLDQSLIEKIVPDEVPHPEPAPPQVEVPDAPKPAPAVYRGAGLRNSVYSDLIATAAQAHGVDPILIQAVIQVESNYQPRARSHKGAMGLMQLMPATAREYRVRNAYDPKANINAGIQKLKGLLNKWGDVSMALAAYNAGEGAVARFNGIPPYRETQNYVTKILSLAGLR